MTLGTTTYGITFKKNENKVWTNIFNKAWECFDSFSNEGYDLIDLYKSSKKMTEAEILNKVNSLKLKYQNAEHTPEEIAKALSAIHRFRNFFKEFDFEANFRILNTVSRFAKDLPHATEYVVNYFKLSNNIYSNSICEKVKSAEFKSIIADLADCNTTKQINNRLKIYYGSAGSGKTTKASAEANGYVIPCKCSLLPDELMKGLNFVNGQPTFQKSPFLQAVTEGYTVVLDEINLLPFDTLRFLQNILDGKLEFKDDIFDIKVHPNFTVIGTMNLVIGEEIYGLPAPLVDRTADIIEFKVTDEMLLSAIW